MTRGGVVAFYCAIADATLALMVGDAEAFGVLCAMVVLWHACLPLEPPCAEVPRPPFACPDVPRGEPWEGYP